ncbi:hypothetical protein LTS18_011962, partial [Coniosporium uncinatum]
AGEAIAKQEEKEGFDTNPDAPVNAEGEAWKPEPTGDAATGGDSWAPEPVSEDAAAPPAEPEDKTKSYDDYLKELAEKKLQIGGGALAARKPNEGSSGKQPEGKAFAREGEEDFMAGSAKAKREREKKDKKQFVELDDARVREEFREGGSRGGRGRGRGDGPSRGGRGGGRGRGERGGDRGGFRGDRGDGYRPRGGRGGAGGAAPSINDQSAFPSLGGK